MIEIKVDYDGDIINKENKNYNFFATTKISSKELFNKTHEFCCEVKSNYKIICKIIGSSPLDNGIHSLENHLIKKYENIEYHYKNNIPILFYNSLDYGNKKKYLMSTKHDCKEIKIGLSCIAWIYGGGHMDLYDILQELKIHNICNDDISKIMSELSEEYQIKIFNKYYESIMKYLTEEKIEKYY